MFIIFYHSDLARQLTKQQLRNDALIRMINGRAQDLDNYVKLFTSASIQDSLEVFINALKDRKK
jgi:uncharacterized Fe-S cluster-containing MiaB family protein